MPELPEVETIARTLAPQVEGQKITALSVLNDSSISGNTEAFHALVGRTIARVHRRGKLLLMTLVPTKDPQHAYRIGVHLKMSGRLFIYPPDMQPEKHTRILFDLSCGKRLFFDDMRKFGYCRAMTHTSDAQWKFWQTLGPEPLEITATNFATLFKDRRTRIKAALLDQTVLAGIGNIYADESLFRAGIRPDTACAHIPEKRLHVLHHELQTILELSIRECGSSIKDYRNANGDAGAFQNTFRVYGRKGKTCVTCGKPLSSGKVAGRTTIFCPHCQK